MNNHYKIQITEPADANQLMHGAYLAMISVSNIPHLVIVIDGRTYSLSVKGAAVDGDLRSLLRTIELRSIGSIFVKLAIPADSNSRSLSAIARKHVLSYSSLGRDSTTCLAPVKDFCNEVYGVDVTKVNFIYALLPVLEERKAILSSYHLNLDEHLHEGEFFLRKYTMNDISEEIRRSLTVNTRI